MSRGGLSRREFLYLSGALAAGSRSARADDRPRARPAPKGLAIFLLSGGVDAIWTTDPKIRSQLAPDVDLQYDEQAIRSFGGLRVGPHLAPLGERLGRFAVLNGVACSTVAHEYGRKMAKQMRRTIPAGAPDLATTLGLELDDDRPLASVHIGRPLGPEEMAAQRGRDLNWSYDRDPWLWTRLWEAARQGDQRAAIGQALAAHAARLDGDDRRAYVAARRLVDLLALAPRPPEPPRMPSGALVLGAGAPRAQPAMSATTAEAIEMIAATMAWLLAQRIASAVHYTVPLPWDTHVDNDALQWKQAQTFNPGFARFLDLLDLTRMPGGHALKDEAAVLVSSELGRFPRVNRYAGKDHLPELPVLIAGPGIRPGSYGETDRNMAATPISFSSGRPGGAGAGVPVLEDLGTSVLSWMGARDPIGAGYLGRELQFLFA